jgi:hypothetical protein
MISLCQFSTKIINPKAAAASLNQLIIFFNYQERDLHSSPTTLLRSVTIKILDTKSY